MGNQTSALNNKIYIGNKYQSKTQHSIETSRKELSLKISKKSLVKSLSLKSLSRSSSFFRLSKDQEEALQNQHETIEKLKITNREHALRIRELTEKMEAMEKNFMELKNIVDGNGVIRKIKNMTFSDMMAERFEEATKLQDESVMEKVLENFNQESLQDDETKVYLNEEMEEDENNLTTEILK